MFVGLRAYWGLGFLGFRLCYDLEFIGFRVFSFCLGIFRFDELNC